MALPCFYGRSNKGLELPKKRRKNVNSQNSFSTLSPCLEKNSRRISISFTCATGITHHNARKTLKPFAAAQRRGRRRRHDSHVHISAFVINLKWCSSTISRLLFFSRLNSATSIRRYETTRVVFDRRHEKYFKKFFLPTQTDQQ